MQVHLGENFDYLENMSIPSLSRAKRNILRKIYKSDQSPVDEIKEYSDDIQKITYTAGTFIKETDGAISDKAYIYAPAFTSFSPEEIHKLKMWGISKICVYTTLFGKPITFRSTKFEDIDKFTKIDVTEAGLILGIFLALIFLIFILNPQLF